MLVRRFLVCARTLFGVSPVSSLFRLDVQLSSSLLCVLRHVQAVSEEPAKTQAGALETHLAFAASRSWHLRLSVEFLWFAIEP